MSKPLKCEMCLKDMGEVEKGRIRNGAVVLCSECWEKKQETIGRAVKHIMSEEPDIVNKLFGEFGK